MSEPKFTAAQVIEALDQSKGIQAIAARILGCHRNTVRRYVREDEEVGAALSVTKNTNLDMAESQLLTAIGRAEPWAIKFYLSTQGRDRGYGRVVALDPDSPPIPLALTVTEPDSERIAGIVAVLREAGVFDQVMKANGEAPEETLQ